MTGITKKDKNDMLKHIRAIYKSPFADHNTKLLSIIAKCIVNNTPVIDDEELEREE